VQPGIIAVPERASNTRLVKSDKKEPRPASPEASEEEGSLDLESQEFDSSTPH